MSLLSLTSGQSAYYGYEYFKKKKVLSIEKIDETSFTGVVSGSHGARYAVTIDTAHARKSHCACPHAAGRRVVCKHMIALYFTAFPKEAKKYIAELEAYWEEEEERGKEIYQKLVSYVRRMKKPELQDALLTLLTEGPDWQYDQFVDLYLDWDDEK